MASEGCSLDLFFLSGFVGLITGLGAAPTCSLLVSALVGALPVCLGVTIGWLLFGATPTPASPSSPKVGAEESIIGLTPPCILQVADGAAYCESSVFD